MALGKGHVCHLAKLFQKSKQIYGWLCGLFAGNQPVCSTLFQISKYFMCKESIKI
jgi:hypothetical protein